MKISALDGGDEAKRLARLISRMLIRAAAARAVAYEILDEEGMEAMASGPGASLLMAEAGLHKFVTAGKGGKRHTSYCKVEASQARAPSAREAIKESDVEFKSQKAGGPGGQHVNKTESAVRATHRPTGLSVLCASERSQAENKRIAVAWLSAKMADADREAALASKQQAWRSSNRQGAGEAARSYWLDEDRCMDAKTGQKIRASDALDGKCEKFWPQA